MQPLEETFSSLDHPTAFIPCQPAECRFKDWQNQQVDNFIVYLNKHRHHIVNYDYFRSNGISIGSGTIESTVKQIAGCIKLSGAQWKADHVPQVLLHRCAYLNRQFSN
jgi:hypothetical protein